MSILPSLNEPATTGNVVKLILFIGGLGLLGWFGLNWLKSKPKLSKKKKNPVKGIPVIDNSDEEDDEDEDEDEDEVEEDEDEDVEELSQYY